MSEQIAKAKVVVRLHRSPTEIAAIRDVWARMSVDPNSDPEHTLLVCGLRSEVISPCVISVWVDCKCSALVIARFEHSRVSPRIGYLRLPSVMVRALVLLQGGFLGDLGPDAAEAVMDEMLAMSSRHEVDIIRCSAVPDNSVFLDAVRQRKIRTVGLRRPRWAAHWEMDLDRTAGYLVDRMKSKHRSWFRRKACELDKAMSGQLQWGYHQGGDEIVSLCGEMESVAKRTYQRGLGAGFRDDHEHRERLGMFARRGMFRAIVARADGKPLAFWYGVRYGDVFHSLATGYLADLHAYEIGTQMFIRLVDFLAGEGVTRLDFGLGDAAYKQRFGTRSWRECDVSIVPRSFKGGMVWGCLAGCEFMERGLRGLVTRLGYFDRVKKVWRQRLAGRVAVQEREQEAQK